MGSEGRVWGPRGSRQSHTTYIYYPYYFTIVIFIINNLLTLILKVFFVYVNSKYMILMITLLWKNYKELQGILLSLLYFYVWLYFIFLLECVFLLL